VATAWLFRPHGAPRPLELAELPRVVSADQNFAWVDLSEYGDEDLRGLRGLLRLDGAAVDAALSPWQRPTLDVFADQYFVSTTVAHTDPGGSRVRASELDLFVGRNFLVSAHKLPLPFGDRLLARARRSPELVPLDSAFMLYLVLDELLAYYEGLGEGVEDEVERMEERALTDPSEAVLPAILRLKRYAFAVSRLVDQHRAVFAAFRRADFPFVAGETVDPYYRDLQRRLERLVDTVLPAKEAANGAFAIYVSHMAHRTNRVMKLLTIVSTVLLPAGLILGFFGTHFDGLPLSPVHARRLRPDARRPAGGARGHPRRLPPARLVLRPVAFAGAAYGCAAGGRAADGHPLAQRPGGGCPPPPDGSGRPSQGGLTGGG
jgi:magnesium transporter